MAELSGTRYLVVDRVTDEGATMRLTVPLEAPSELDCILKAVDDHESPCKAVTPNELRAEAGAYWPSDSRVTPS